MNEPTEGLVFRAWPKRDEETSEPEVTAAIPESVLAFSREDGGSAEYVALPQGTALTLSSCKVTFTAYQYPEERLREIVREEINKWQERQVREMIRHGQPTRGIV